MEIIENLAQIIFDYYVVNPFAIAIQQNNGVYITKYVQYNFTFLKNMIEKNGSAGCYQQGYRNGLMKWVCLDFDCKDKQNPNVIELSEYIEEKVIPVLNKYEIRYLKEFSGRRGIHIWILFQGLVTKKDGFLVLEKICKEIKMDDRFGLDRFPANGKSNGNKVGKQVKFPLSVHKMGGRSFFFKDKLDLDCQFSSNFFQDQLCILKNYERNTIDDLFRNLEIKSNSYSLNEFKNIVYEGDEIDYDSIITELGNYAVFRQIFFNLKNGLLENKDLFVLLGCFGRIHNGELVHKILGFSPSYNRDITHDKILQLKNDFVVPTLGYLYRAYNLELEELDPNETILECLFNKDLILDVYSKDQCTEEDVINNLSYYFDKEKKYIFENDENIEISTLIELEQKNDDDLFLIKSEIEKIKNGKRIESKDIVNFYRIDRIESEEKMRRMVILGASERIITTYLATQIAYAYKEIINSFSYNVNFLSKTDIFYNWFSSWSNYINKIKSYIDLPYQETTGLIYLDLKSFYDSIDFLSVYSLISTKLKEEKVKYLRYLTSFNDVLMRKVNDNKSRIGVPQGPAYARIMAEIYLGTIINMIKDEIDISFTVYRYVDDICIFYEGEENGIILFNHFILQLRRYGLEINQEKSKLYGLVAKLDEYSKDEILRQRKFNYDYRNTFYNNLKSDSQKYDTFMKDLLKFDVEECSRIFSKSTEYFYKKLYFLTHATSIYSSIYGRGNFYIKFHQFVFTNPEILQWCLDNKVMRNMKVNSLCQKTFISTLYIYVKNRTINKGTLNEIFDICFNDSQYISILEVPEQSTLSALDVWRKEYD